MKPVGFADDDPAKRSESYRGLKVLGTTGEVRDLIHAQEVDTVFLALPVEAHRTMLAILKDVGNEMIDLRVVPDLFQYVTFKAGIEDFDGLPVINLTQMPLEGWNSLVKRTMDVVLSALGLVALAVLFPFIALAIWLEDRGPIFYAQERMGLDGRLFRMIKFRSMGVDAEPDGARWAKENDPRRTRVGSVPAQDVTRRAAAARERLHGRHVARRAAAGAARVREGVQGEVPAVHAPSPRAGGDHGLGADPRLARQHADRQARRVRPVLHRELVGRARREDPLGDGPLGLHAQECVLR